MGNRIDWIPRAHFAPLEDLSPARSDSRPALQLRATGRRAVAKPRSDKRIAPPRGPDRPTFLARKKGPAPAQAPAPDPSGAAAASINSHPSSLPPPHRSPPPPRPSPVL